MTEALKISDQKTQVRITLFALYWTLIYIFQYESMLLSPGSSSCHCKQNVILFYYILVYSTLIYSILLSFHSFFLSSFLLPFFLPFFFLFFKIYLIFSHFIVLSILQDESLFRRQAEIDLNSEKRRMQRTLEGALSQVTDKIRRVGTKHKRREEKHI